MEEHILTNSEARVFAALALQKQQLQATFAEVVEAEVEQCEYLRLKHGLPEGEYSVRQEPDGSVVLFAVPDEQGE